MGFMAIYIVIVLAVIEIAVVLMRATGLERSVARFQVISLLTSTGYTTKESELISEHPVRRRIGMFLILFGVFSFAVIVSAIANILAPGFRISYMGLCAAILLALLLCLRMPWAEKLLSARFDRTMEEKFEIHDFPIKDVLLFGSGDVFIEVPIGERSPHIGGKLADIVASAADLNALYLKRGTVTLRKGRHDAVLEAGDVLCLYGDREEVTKLFARELAELPKEESVASA